MILITSIDLCNNIIEISLLRDFLVPIKTEVSFNEVGDDGTWEVFELDNKEYCVFLNYTNERARYLQVFVRGNNDYNELSKTTIYIGEQK